MKFFSIATNLVNGRTSAQKIENYVNCRSFYIMFESIRPDSDSDTSTIHQDDGVNNRKFNVKRLCTFTTIINERVCPPG